METLLCDVVGCGRKATWIHIAPVSSTDEDLLCHRCWANLRASHPEVSACYVVTEEEFAVQLITADDGIFATGEMIG